MELMVKLPLSELVSLPNVVLVGVGEEGNEAAEEGAWPTFVTEMIVTQLSLPMLSSPMLPTSSYTAAGSTWLSFRPTK